MKMVKAFSLAVGIAFALVSTSALAGGDPARGEKVFRKCKACHTIKAGGKHRVGPNLHGVVGRKAGSAPGYKYSKAMKNAGFVWDEEKLDKFLTKPRKFVKKTKMTFPGLRKAKDREDVIAYLKKMSQ